MYRHPRTATLLFLGFSAGLPYLLVFSTLSARLVDADISRGIIGILSLAGIAYSIKVLWAPLVDRYSIPWLSARLGHRRSWMLVSQIIVAAGLAAMAFVDAGDNLWCLSVLAVIVAISSATQDIAIDAFRIESASERMQAALATAYLLGYRIALVFAGAGALFLADVFNWQVSYLVMACAMVVGAVTVLLARTPERESARHTNDATGRATWHWRDFISPFVDFFTRYGRFALWVLLFVGIFRMSDITMGVMANPFYLDSGYTKSDIATMSKIFGFAMTILGAGLGGVLAARYEVMRLLPIVSVLPAATNLLFAWLSTQAPSLPLLGLVISADNLSGGMATSVFIAYLSSLTRTGYTATQYAMFSSLMTLPAKLIGGASGFVVEAAGYMYFFIYTAAIGIPAILLSIWFWRRFVRYGTVVGSETTYSRPTTVP